MEFLERLRQIERKWQQRWQEAKIFEPKPDPSKPKYFLTVPYPYVSGPLHIGHGRTYTQGDIIARYKRLKGYNVLFPMASHVTGTPIFAISDSIRRGDEKVINLYREYIKRFVEDEKEVERILESFKDPENVALFFAKVIEKDFNYLGYSIDWTRWFHTAEPWYNKFIEWQYYKLREKGVITKGEHYVTYCLLHKQAVGEDDIKDADVNPVEIVEFVGIKFEFEDGYIIAATLRPETIYGCTNLWVKPDATYVKLRVKDEIWYVSKEASAKIEHQFDDVKVLEEIEGKYFIGKKAKTPLGDEVYILPADFVDPDVATGFVYSEPADAPYDFVALRDLKRHPEILEKYGVNPKILDEIKIKKIIDVPGVKEFHAAEVVEKMGIENQNDPRLEEATQIVYKEQFYNGKMIVEDLYGIPVREAKEIMRERLLAQNKAVIIRETSRKAVCRGGGKIIVAKIKNQWFINYNIPEWKKKTKEWLDKMIIYPEKYRKLFYDTVDWLEKRPCARKRGLGTRLPWDPEWIIESLSDSTIYMAFYTIAHRIKKYDPNKLIPELFDYIFLGEGDPEELSKKTGIPKEEIEEMRKEFDYWYPNDHRHTAIGHITNHLTFFIMHHILLFPEKYWPRIITLNEMLIREGQKMSKSKGNVILLRDIAEKYSADLFRLYISWAASWDTILDWKEKEIQMVIKELQKFYKILEDAINAEGEFPKDRIDYWLLNRFKKRVKLAEEQLENFRVREYIQNMFFDMLNDLEYYKKRTSEERLKVAVKNIMKDWLIVLSPVIPHLCEEFWERIGEEGFISLAKWPEVGEIEEKCEIEEEILNNVIKDIEEVKKLVERKGGKVSKIKIIVAAEWKYEMYNKIKELLEKGERDVKKIREIIFSYEEAKKNANIFGKLPVKIRQEGLNVFLDRESERKLLEEEKDYIERVFGVPVEIEIEEESTEEKKIRALPGKPAIVVS